MTDLTNAMQRNLWLDIFTSADWRCQREKWIIWGMEKCHWRAFFSVVQRRWSKTSKEATWTYEFEHQLTAHTYLHSCCAHSWPRTLNYYNTLVPCAVHSQQFVSLRCLLVAPRWGTDAWKQNFLVRVPDPLAQGNFCHFFVPKILGNLAALFEKSGKICQAMIAIWAMRGHADGSDGE